MTQNIQLQSEVVGDHGSVKPSNRELFIRAALEKKFGVKDPERWIVAQSEADEPAAVNRSTSNWSNVWHKCPQPLALDVGRCIWLLRKYCKRLTPPDILEPQSVTYTMVKLLILTEVELFDAGDGYYLVIPGQDRLYKLHQGPRDNGTRCHVYSTAEFTPAEYYGLIDASIFWAWRGTDREKAAEARAYICGIYAKAIEDAAHEAEEDYERSLIAQGKVDLGPATAVASVEETRLFRQALFTVVYENDKGVITAELFSGDRFTPESFRDVEVHLIDLSRCRLDDFLRGTERRFIFKRRILDHTIRDAAKKGKKLCFVTVKENDIPINILLADRTALKGTMPTGEPILSPTA